MNDSLGFEKKVLQAAALVQAEAKCPVSIHPGRSPQSPSEVLRVFQEAGGDASKVALCHLDSKSQQLNSSIFTEIYIFGFQERWSKKTICWISPKWARFWSLICSESNVRITN